MGYRYRPHTADELLESWGDTRERCISELATGFVAGFARVSEGCDPQERPFAIDLGESAGIEESVVTLLEEILFVVETKAEVPIRTEVTSVATGRIEGTFYVVPVESVEETGAVPKAVSYAEFCMEESEGGIWRARVTIDV